MSHDFMKVYDASNAAEAELIREAMQAAGIRAYIDTTPSPLDGLTAMGQGIAILVDGEQADEARKVIDDFCRRKGAATEEAE